MRYHYEQCPKCAARGRDNSGDNLAVYDDGSGHCFACGYHISQRFSFSSIKKPQYVNESVLSAGFTEEIPQWGWQWLLQYGRSRNHWEGKVGWDEASSRLVFAVPDIQSVAFSQGRLIQAPASAPPVGRQPAKWFNWGDSHASPYVVRAPTEDSKCIVLVEDWISANVVSQVTPAISLFGTRVFDSVFRLLIHLHLPIVLWLDADQQGTTERKALQLSMLTGLPCSVIHTESDPKLLTIERIKHELSQISYG